MVNLERSKGSVERELYIGREGCILHINGSALRNRLEAVNGLVWPCWAGQNTNEALGSLEEALHDCKLNEKHKVRFLRHIRSLCNYRACRAWRRGATILVGAHIVSHNAKNSFVRRTLPKVLAHRLCQNFIARRLNSRGANLESCKSCSRTFGRDLRVYCMVRNKSLQEICKETNRI